MRAEISGQNRFEKRYLAALACIEIVGLIARLIGIRNSLNYDEIFSLQAANGSWQHTFQIAMGDRTHPPLHLLLLHVWTHLFGSSELAVRSMSVVFSLLFLFLVWKIARQHFSFTAAVISASICALSPFFIGYGIENRPYSLVALLSVLSVDRLLAWVRCPNRPQLAVLFTATGTCLILAQYPGAVFVGAEIAILIILYRFRIATALLFPITLLPGTAWYLVSKTLYTAQISELIGWIEKPTVLDLITLPCSFLGWINLRHASILLYLLMLLALYGLISRFATQTTDTKKHTLLLAILALSVPVSLYILSVVSGTSYWAGRQMIGSSAAAMLLVGAGVSFLPSTMRYATFTMLTLWATLASYLGKPAVMGPAWREIASDIQKRYPGRPLVVSEEWCASPLEYYSKRTVEQSRTVSEQALTQGAVFVCRPFDCSFIAQDPHLKRAMTYDDSSQSPTNTIWVFDEK